MNADERKHLESNELAGWATRTVNNIKANPQRLGVWAGILVLLFAVYLGFRYLTGLTGSTQSGLILRLDHATNEKDLENIREEAQGAPAGLIARFHLARELFTMKGFENLNASNNETRQSGVTALEKARDEYRKLAEEARKIEPVLAREALLAQAQIEETLAGVPVGTDPNETRGKLKTALELYQRLAKETPDTSRGKMAAKRAKELETNLPQAEAIYKELAQQYATRNSSAAPVLPPSTPAANPFLPPGLPIPPFAQPATTGAAPKPAITAPAPVTTAPAVSKKS